MKKISESIFAIDIIPMADIVSIEKRRTITGNCSKSICLVMKGTTHNTEFDDYNNAVYLYDIDNQYSDASDFIEAWSYYRHEYDEVNIIELQKETE